MLALRRATARLLKCNPMSALSKVGAIVCLLIWLAFAHSGYVHTHKLALATGLETKHGAAHESLQVFNDNLLNRAAFLNPMPTVAYIRLKAGSKRTSVLGTELKAFNEAIAPLPTCVNETIECDLKPPFDLDWKSIPCNTCKIPGAVCGAQRVHLFDKPQPLFYNAILSISGYYQNVTAFGEKIARERYISKDGKATIIVFQGSVPKCSNTLRWYPLSDWLNDRLKNHFPEEEFHTGITSWSEQMRATIKGSVKDTATAHMLTLPIAWAVLFLTVGPTAIFVFVIMPVALFSTIYILVLLQYSFLFTWPHISPGMWVSILVAMCIDYALFILSRWREERLAGTRSDAAVASALNTAGKTVLLSGIILAISFFALLMIETPLVQQVGVSCGTVILVCVAANLTLIPAFLTILPDFSFWYARNRRFDAAQRRCTRYILRSVPQWPLLTGFIKMCLMGDETKDDQEEGDEGPTVATYARLEMAPIPGAAIAQDDDAEYESVLDEMKEDEDVELKSGDEREMMTMKNYDDEKMTAAKLALALNSSDDPDLSLNPDLRHSIETRRSRRISSSSDVGLLAPVRRRRHSSVISESGDSVDDKVDSPIEIDESELKAIDEEDERDESPQKLVTQPVRQSSPLSSKSLVIPSNSIWVKIALICRKRPLTVISIITLVGLPLALQCIRMHLSSSFEQLMLGSSMPVKLMHEMTASGFNAGIINKQYIIVTMGPPISKQNHTRNSDKTDTDQDIDHAGGGQFKGANCEEGIDPYGDKVKKNCINKKCYMDDPDGWLKSNLNKTCPELINMSISYLMDSLPMGEASARTTVCKYDPNDDNPAYPSGYTVSYVCPQSCDVNCSALPPSSSPTVASDSNAPSASPTVTQVVESDSFDQLFECEDDVGGWINRISPCFIEPGGNRFVCHRPSRVNCGLASVTLGKSCTTKTTGTHVGAGGQSNDEERSGGVDFGHICPKTCNLCPFEQRIFTREVFSSLHDLIDELLRLPVLIGKRGLMSITFLDGEHIGYDEAIQMLNETKPGLVINYQETNHTSIAYRAMIRTLKSLMGSATVIELTPMWNSVGAHSADMVYQIREALQKSQRLAEKNDGVKWKIYFEGMAPIIMDLKTEMYKSAPYFMLLAMVVVVLVLTGLSFQSATIGLRLLITVAFSLLWVFGIMTILLQDVTIPGSQKDGLHFIVPIMNIPVLVGLTLDYDLFLLVRIHEYRMEGFSSQDATMAAMYKTSGIITVAGLVMLTAFSALISSDLFILKTTGLLIVLTCFIDTFIVRAWLVPALLMVGVEWNWWPGRVPKVTRRCVVVE